MPHIRIGIDARGVVAAAVQQHHIPRLRRRQIREHAVKIQRVALGLPAIQLHRQTGPLEYRTVVHIAGVRAPNRGVGAQAGQHIPQHTQSACPADRLDHMAARDPRGRIAQDQPRHTCVEHRIARQSAVGFRRTVLRQGALGHAHRLHIRCGPVVIAVDADDHVDLVGARIGAKGRGQTPDRVFGKGGKRVEHRGYSLGRLASMTPAQMMRTAKIVPNVRASCSSGTASTAAIAGASDPIAAHFATPRRAMAMA